MASEDGPALRPWAINRVCLCLSLVLAALATGEMLFASLFAMITEQRSIFLWGFTIVWPIYYGIVYLIAYGIALIDQRGPATQQLGWLGKLFGPFRPSLDYFYHAAPNVMLILFPVLFATISTALAWCTWTKQLNLAL